LYPGGGIKTLQQVQRVIEKAGRLLGRDFRGNVFLGHNPFGPPSNIASRFTAYLDCPAAGEYNFACSSQDASFLLIDDTLVVANGGHHPPQRDISMRGNVRLTKGLHKLTFYHVNATGDPVAVAAWQAPGEKRIWPIPAKAFAPVSQATPGAMEQYGKSMGVDFIFRYGGESFLRNRYYQRWVFEAMTVGNVGRDVNLQWDFGDGQKAASPKAEHVFLTPGEHTVRLSAKTYRGVLERTNRIFVSRPWDQVTTNRLDSVVQHARIVSGYDFAALTAEANAQAILLLERARAADAVRRAGEAFVARGEAPPPLISQVVPMIAEAMPPKQRRETFLKAADMTRNAAVRADMTERAGRVTLRDLGDTKEAMSIFQRVLRQFAALTSGQAIRRAKIGIGDVWRARGDYQEARKAYTTAGYGPDVNVARLEITKGDYARHVEDYLRKDAFTDAAEFVEQWEMDIPLDKLEGYWSLLVVRMHLARKQYNEAALEARTLVKVNPASNYAAQLLLLAAEAYRKLGKDDEAKAALRQLVEKYPESPLVGEAAKALK
ncbi:MAG: tetratricopeptide repeat protein, partial [Phycisphaerae bacterium]